MTDRYYRHPLHDKTTARGGVLPAALTDHAKTFDRPDTVEERERRIDDALAGTFPASDPPPWTLGRCSPNSRRH